MTIKYSNTQDMNAVPYIRGLIYGPPGVGKTWLASTFPDPVFIDLDVGGILCVNHPTYKKLYPDRNIRYRSFDEELDENGLFVSAKAFMDAVRFINEVANDDSVGTIVVDSLTTLQVYGMNLGLELSQAHKRSKTLQKARYGTHVIPLPTQADFGSEMRAFEQFMNGFVNIKNKHLLCLAHERTEQNSTGSITRVDPLLIGSSVRAMIGSWFHEVWYLDSLPKGRRQILTETTGVYKVLKSRAGLPDEFQSSDDGKLAPDFQDIHDAILNPDTED